MAYKRLRRLSRPAYCVGLGHFGGYVGGQANIALGYAVTALSTLRLL